MIRCPACNGKATPGKGGLMRCQKCKGLFDFKEIASGRVEGGTHGARPDQRLIMEESGGPTGAPIRQQRQLKGGL